MDRIAVDPNVSSKAGRTSSPLSPDSAGTRMVRKRVGGVELIGFSVAGEESVVAAPEFNVCFDIGRAPREVIPIDFVCISHGHMDHAAGAAYYLSQRGFLDLAPGSMIVHRSLAQFFQQLMAVWADIEGHHSPGQIIGVEHLQDVMIRRGLLVRPFSVNHHAGALGFTLVERRHRLRAEFHGKTGPELVAMKKQGVQIDEDIEVSIVTYTGDTAYGRFLELPFVRTSRVMVIECTFFDREHRGRASAGRHIHVDDLPRVLEAVPDAQVVLTHVSRRTDPRAAKRILQRVVGPSDLERVCFLMDRPRRDDRTEHEAR